MTPDERAALVAKWEGHSLASVPTDREALDLSAARGFVMGAHRLMAWIIALLRNPDLFGANDAQQVAFSVWLDRLTEQYGKPPEWWLEDAIEHEIDQRRHGLPPLMGWEDREPAISARTGTHQPQSVRT